MLGDYLPVLLMFIAGGAVALGFLLAAMLFGPKNPTKKKLEPFECGMTPFSIPRGRLSVPFFLTAILFLIFDVEIVFLYPWAVMFRRLHIFAYIEMIVFLLVLVLGFIYIWRKGGLEWQ